MKKYLYVLKIKGQAFVMLENKKLKYFDSEEENIEKYLRDKISFKYLEKIREKDIEYYEESLKVILLNINGYEDFIDDKDIIGINSLEEKDISFKDFKLLDSFFEYGFNLKKVKEISVAEKEKKTAIKNLSIALIIAVLTSIFYMTGNEINYLGISYPIITCLIAIGGIYSIGRVKKLNYLGLYFVITAILLSMTYGIFTNMIFRVINFFLIPLTLVTGLYLISYAKEEFDYLNFLSNIVPSITVGIVFHRPFVVLKSIIGKIQKGEVKSSRLKEIQKGILISIPLLIVLIILLSRADAFFGEIFVNIGTRITEFFNEIKIDGIIAKLIMMALVFIIIYCFLHMLKVKELRKIKEIRRTIDCNMANTVLVMVNILYGFFTFVQVKYLYIRYTGSLSAEMYADYAREGFFQLAFVVIINIAIILLFENKVKINNLTKILNTIMTAISMSMSVSSIYKMSLYIRQYGLTRLRFMTSIFMIFILLSLIFIAVSLWKKMNLFKYIILLGSIFYIFINFVNMDKCITSYNLTSVQGEIDMHYLRSLSKDSIDVMKKYYDEGKIDKITFQDYIKINKDYKWFEYNYYNGKKFS